jgi:hypothetical protein
LTVNYASAGAVLHHETTPDTSRPVYRAPYLPAISASSIASAALSAEMFESRHLYPNLSENTTFRRWANGYETSRGLGEEWRGFEEGPRYVLSFEVGLEQGRPLGRVGAAFGS